jgi:aspartyl-tRNA(Asn)/glutamyl-tRNA(Gln) amidotransferase subunit C
MASQKDAKSNNSDQVAEQKIDVAKIHHIAKLARLGISDEEAERYAGQMNSVLGYMDILNEVKTDGVEMTLQVNDLKNVTRPDEVKVEVDSAALLETSTLPKISGQIAVRAVIKEE